MADLVFNAAKGKAAYYSSLPNPGDVLVLVPLLAAGLVDDDTLMEQATLADVLLLAAEQLDMGRLEVTFSSATIDTVNDWTDVDFDDPVWPGATGEPCGALLVCYKPGSASGDGDILPLTKHDFIVTPNGTDLVGAVSITGFYRAT